MSVRISLTLEGSEMFLSLHMIFSLERAAVVCAILERISGFDPSLEMIALRYLKFPLLLASDLYLDLSLETIRVVFHHFCLVWTDLHFVSCGGSIKTVYQDASLFFLFRIYDSVICKAEVGNESSPDAELPSWSSKASHMILSMKMLKRVGESRHPCRTPSVVLNHSPVLPMNRTALWALSYRFSTQPWIRFDLEKLNDPTVMSALQTTIGGRFAPLTTIFGISS